MTARSSIASRKTDVPPNFMLKWQSHGPRGAKGNAHRPLTACRACRTAKTRCDGKRNCRRCTARGLVCSFERSDVVVGSATPSPWSQASSTLHNAQSEHFPSRKFIAAGEGTDSNFSSTSNFQIPAFEHMAHEAETREPVDNVSLPVLNNVQITAEAEEYSVDLADLDQLPSPGDWDFFFQSLPSTTNQSQEPRWTSEANSTANPTHATVPAETASAPPTPAAVTCDVSRMHSTPKCPCRDKLSALLPQVNEALQQNRLDKVFEITHDVMRAGKGIIDCTSCEMRCVDLICMMTIFRQTDRCFEFIAKADVDDSIIMSYGGFDLPVCDPQLRAMLVANLVHYSLTVVDEVGTTGHKMLEELNPPNELAKTNIAYLDSVIRDFKATIARVVKSNSGTTMESLNS
ncbi:hypothetical protein CC79DRAFT_1399097 [Sarocladium strictum]